MHGTSRSSRWPRARTAAPTTNRSCRQRKCTHAHTVSCSALRLLTSSEPSTPAIKFATSVTRKKTRKWVEAKKINYDGSGWGDDDDDDDDDEYEEEAAAPQMPAGPAQAAPLALPSQQSSLPSAALLSRNPSPHPALHLQTEQQPPASSLPSQSLPSQSLPSQQPWRQGSPAPSSTRNSSPGITSPRSGALPTWRDGRSESPLGPRGQSPANSAGPNGPRAFVRPSDIYKRSIGQDEPPAKKTAELPAAPAPAPAPVELPAEAVEPERKNVPPPISNYAEPVTAASPQPTTQRKALNVANSTPTPPPAPAPVVETVVRAPAIAAAESATETATDANGERRFSSSPKLPDLARFSMFSPDLLFGGASLLSSNAPPVPSVPNSPATASFPGQEAAPAAAPQTKLASVAEDVDRTSGTASPFSASSIKSGSAIRDSAATTTTTATADQGDTSSAVGSGKSSPAAEPDNGKTVNVKEEPASGVATTSSPGYSAADQVAPLKPSRASQMLLPSVSLPVAPMGPRVLERAGTADTVSVSASASASATSSPVKESDVLSEEIIRTLSPVKSDPNQNQKMGAINDNAASTVTPSDEPTRTLTRDSSYLQDVYDDYWTPDDASGHGAYTPPPVPPLSTANTAAASAPVAVPAITASPEMTTASPYNLPSQTQRVPPLAKSPSPAPATAPATAPAIAPAPASMPASISSVPGTRSSSAVKARNLRRRFSWEAEPESSPSAVTAGVAPVQSAQSASPAPLASAIATLPAMQGHSSPSSDPKASVSAVSAVSARSASQEPLASPSPLSDVPAAGASPSHADTATERPVTQTQAPVRSMLDIGDEKPAVRSMLDIDDVPATPPAPAAVAVPVSPVDDVASPVTIAAAVAAAGTTAAGAAAAVATNRTSGTASLRSARSAQSVQSPLPAAPSSAQSNQAGLGGANPAVYGSGSEGSAQFLTLRQCMAFGSHSERMAKLTETRREYAAADSGLSGWLTSMAVIPEYARASYAPLWDGPLTVPPPSRPAAAVAAIAHVPHVNISSSQISNKSKEIFGVAAGKAGKGFLALRKKGFHKKSGN